MAADGNGKAANGSVGPATNGKAYPIEDHTYDVVVFGAGGAPLRALVGLGGHVGAARQHAAGRLALAYVRHRQGVGLARRPGRDRIYGAQRARSRLRTRALGRAVLAHRGGRKSVV